MSYNCKKCGEDELVELPVCSDPQGLRSDYFCCECNTRFGMTAAGFFIVSEPCDTSAVVRENRELKITIRKMMEIKEDS
jgi:hypothetical protein